MISIDNFVRNKDSINLEGQHQPQRIPEQELTVQFRCDYVLRAASEIELEAHFENVNYGTELDGSDEPETVNGAFWVPVTTNCSDRRNQAQHIRRQFEKLADRELSERQAAFGLGTIVYQGPTWICDHEGEIVMDYDFRASTICRYIKKHVRPDVWWLASAKFAFCIPKLRTSQKARHDYVSQLVSDLQELDCEVSDMVIDEDSPFGVGYAITVRHRDMVSAPGGSDDQAWAKEWAMQIAQTMGLSVDLWIGEGVEPTSDTHYEINPHQSQEV